MRSTSRDESRRRRGITSRGAPLLSRMDAVKADNEKAHAAIMENVKENRREIRSMDAKLNTIATDVAYLAGSQADRN